METKFNPNVFLSVPREIQISEAAAAQLDEIAAGEDCLRGTMVMALWYARIAVIQSQHAQMIAEWSALDGGAFSLIFPDGLATIDMLTHDGRVSTICTEQECESAQMDIEDYFNQAGAKITFVTF